MTGFDYKVVVMGRWANWALDSDLTAAEIARVRETCDRMLVPALRVVVERTRPQPEGLAARITNYLALREARTYVNSPDLFSFSKDSISVAPDFLPEPIVVPCSAGEATGKSLGVSDYALFGLLAVIADQTGKLRLLPSFDFQPAAVVQALSMIENAVDYRFHDISGFVAGIATIEDETDPNLPCAPG
jgi:hypothetical protein